MEFIAPILSLLTAVALLVFAKRLHNHTQVLVESTARLERTVNRMEDATKVVAVELASSRQRADAVPPSQYGAAADAAVRSAADSAAVVGRELSKSGDSVEQARRARESRA